MVCPSLQIFKLWARLLSEPSFLTGLFSSCHSLTSLDIGYMPLSNIGLVTLLHRAPRLKVLRVSWSPALDSALSFHARSVDYSGPSDLKSCRTILPVLESLALTGTRLNSACVYRLVCEIPTISTLEISHCPHIHQRPPSYYPNSINLHTSIEVTQECDMNFDHDRFVQVTFESCGYSWDIMWTDRLNEQPDEAE